MMPPVRALAVLALLLLFASADAKKLKSVVTRDHMKVYVAELDPALNFRTLTDYDVKRFFEQFGADPIGVWSNPIGDWVADKDDMELRNTYMYGLDVLFHRQLLMSPLRVHSEAEADVVFIPIYADIGCRLAQEKASDLAAWRSAVDRFWGDFPSRFPTVKTKPHFVVTGRREAENMGGCGMEGLMYKKVKPCNFLCHPYAADLIMLTVEVLAHDLERMGPKPLRPTSVPVPWPGHWHFSSGSPYFRRPFDADAYAATKRYLAMESLRVRLPLRELLYKSCTERADACLHYNPRGRISNFNHSEIYDVIKSAWYCIQPPGDGPTRHATMDCFAAGSQPLFFDEHITAVMPFADILDYAQFTAYIDPDTLVATQDNAIDLLEAHFDEGAALRAAARLHQVKHVFLYSVTPEHALLRFSEMYSIHPLDDGFTASMKALMRKACEMGTLSSDRCSKTEAERAALTATASSAAPFALNRDAARRQAISQAASTAGGGTAAAAAQQSDGSQAEAMAAAGDEMQLVHPVQTVQSQQADTGSQQPAEQTAAESQAAGEAAGEMPVAAEDSQGSVLVSAAGQLPADASQAVTVPAAAETAAALPTEDPSGSAAADVASAASAQEAEPVDTNGAKWDSEAAADAVAQPLVSQPATASLMLGSREAQQQNPATAAGEAAVSGLAQSTEAEARRLVR